MRGAVLRNWIRSDSYLYSSSLKGKLIHCSAWPSVTTCHLVIHYRWPNETGHASAQWGFNQKLWLKPEPCGFDSNVWSSNSLCSTNYESEECQVKSRTLIAFSTCLWLHKKLLNVSWGRPDVHVFDETGTCPFNTKAYNKLLYWMFAFHSECPLLCESNILNKSIMVTSVM